MSDIETIQTDSAKKQGLHSKALRIVRDALRGTGIRVHDAQYDGDGTGSALRVDVRSDGGIPYIYVYFGSQFAGAVVYRYAIGRWESMDSEEWRGSDLAAIVLTLASHKASHGWTLFGYTGEDSSNA